jgi:predicted ATPase/DNA-binding winged helix-turn-helix (wHTH) protein
MSTERDAGVDEDPRQFASFGPFRLFPSARLLEQDGMRVELGGRALEILLVLVEHAGVVVSKAELMSSIWQSTTVVEGVVRTHICHLRKVLGDGAHGARYITSVAGRGYCFVAPVVRTVQALPSSDTSNAPESALPVGKAAYLLPPRLARMAGRHSFVQSVVAQLAEHRFVTILGAAGIGKTTVALSVAHSLLEDFKGAVRFIELGSVMDPALVATTVASALGVTVHADEALPSLRAFLREKRVLLILDNCEHVADSAAQLTEHLFLHAPYVHLLTTSREALRVEGERVRRLDPLETPEEYSGMSADLVQTFPAVQVFLERAAASGWSGDFGDDDVPVVAEICKRLDGVALAIEHAASFVGECGLHGTAMMLEDRLRLLWQPGRRTAPLRQQTLHALVAWSYDRLPERERIALRRLSVLLASFSFDAAKAIALDTDEAGESFHEILNELVSKSLLSSLVEGGSVVYRMLQTTRVFALERLTESDELYRVSLRHAMFFAKRLGSAAGVPRVASDLANVRAALKWCYSSAGGRGIGAPLAAAAAWMLLDFGLVSECHNWCREALGALEAHEARTLVELNLQDAITVAGMYSASGLDGSLRVFLDRGLELARTLTAGDHELRLLGNLSNFLIRTGDWRGALEVAKVNLEATKGAETASTLRAQWMLALSHHLCGNLALAEDHFDTGFRLAGALGEAPMLFFRHSHAVLTLARTMWLRGAPDRALRLARPIIDQAGNVAHPVEKCIVLLLAAPILVWNEDWSEAQRLADMLMEHVEIHSLASHRGVAMFLQGQLLVKTGRNQEGCNLLRSAATELQATGNASHATDLASALAEGLAAIGALDEALDAIERGIEIAKNRGGTWDMPDLLRQMGVLLATRRPVDAQVVDETLSSAIELARSQGAAMLELRAATVLARERLKRGESTDGLRALAALCAKFTEGFETRDFLAARELLEQPVEHPRHQIAQGAGTPLDLRETRA